MNRLYMTHVLYATYGFEREYLKNLYDKQLEALFYNCLNDELG